MSITRYCLNDYRLEWGDVDELEAVPHGEIVLYADHEREMRAAYKLIKAGQGYVDHAAACPACQVANKWLDAHKEYAPKEANRG